ncbi:MAG: selenium cofactor biosynthesis protein YqeC [Colwellia sp.]
MSDLLSEFTIPLMFKIMQTNKSNLSAEYKKSIQRLLSFNKATFNKASVASVCIKDPEVNNTTITISIVGAGGKTHLSYWLANFFKQLGHRVAITTTTKMYLPDKTHFDHILELDNIYETQINNTDIEKLTPQLFCHKQATSAPSTSFLYKNKLPEQPINKRDDLNAETKANTKVKKKADPKTKVKGLSLQQIENLRDSTLFSVLIIEADGANHLTIKAPAAHEPCIAQCSDIVMAITGADAIFSQADRTKIHRWSEFADITHCNESMTIDQAVLKRLINNPLGMFKGSPRQSKKIWVINKGDLSSDPEALLVLANNLLNEEPILTSVWLTQLNSTTAIQKVLIK